MNVFVNVIGVTAAKTKYGGRTWRCVTQEGKIFNVFPEGNGKPGTLHLFGTYAPDILRLGDGETQRWTRHPIGVELAASGDYWNVIAVVARPVGAEPDSQFVPDHALARRAAIVWAQLVSESDAIVWDIETTGTDPLNDEIVSIAAVQLLQSGGQRIVIDQVIRPRNLQRLVESGAGQVNGFSPEDLEGAPSFDQVWERIDGQFIGSPWVVYNATFDPVVLERECLRHGRPPIVSLGINCAMDWYARWLGDWNADRQQYNVRKLVEAAQGFGIDTSRAHDALADVGLTIQVIEGMAKG